MNEVYMVRDVTGYKDKIYLFSTKEKAIAFMKNFLEEFCKNEDYFDEEVKVIFEEFYEFNEVEDIIYFDIYDVE